MLKILEQINFKFLIDYKNNLDEAFIIMGDFNNIMNLWEKERGNGLNLSQVDMFRDFINSMAIKDLNFRGPIFTWNNYRNVAANIKEQLDRVLASVRWMNGFPDFLVEHLEDRGSGHRPILMNTSPSFPKAKKLFFFDSRWTTNLAITEIVRHSWTDNKTGSALFKVYSKLLGCHQAFMEWNKNNPSNSKRRIAQL